MSSIKDYAVSIIQKEIFALQKMASSLNENFEKSIQLLFECKGRIVLTGIGKSALIAQKIAATLNSTGSAALFMHAADAVHGDLGMIQSNDLVIVISKSGESPEIKALLPFILNFGNKVIAICGNEHSYLAKNASLFIDTTVDSEACPNNLAPTTSTTAQLVMGDCIAICLLQLKGFSAKDFAKFHPGGALGKQLYLTVGDLIEKNEAPMVQSSATLNQIIIEISQKRLGATAVMEDAQLLGIITDGDLRRMLENKNYSDSIQAKDICSLNPKTIEAKELAIHALEELRKNNISQIIVLKNEKYTGMVHLHDLIKEGLI